MVKERINYNEEHKRGRRYHSTLSNFPMLLKNNNTENYKETKVLKLCKIRAELLLKAAEQTVKLVELIWTSILVV